MKLFKNTTITLFLILLIAGFLRLWELGNVPISPDWDEVALGYDAYSFIHTGRDEFGKFLPPVLRSFDDYKPALYAYLAVPTVFIYGLNTFAVRLPSAIFGVITVLAVYFLVKELFKRKDIALLASFLLAISPWHIQFSRIAFETNIGLTLNILTALFFIKGLKKPWLLCLSAISSALAIYAYQSEKVFTPLLILFLCAVYFKSLNKLKKKYLISALVVGALTIAPMVSYLVTNKDALLRAQATLVFSDKTVFLENNIKRLDADKKSNDLLGTILDNRRVLYLKAGVSGYISHFDPNWLFVKGDINRHHAPGMGLLYLWELPIVLWGIYKLMFSKEFKVPDKRSVLIVFGWFLIAPIPAAFTSGVPHAVRTLNFLPTYQIFTAVGLLALFNLILNIKHKLLRVSVIGFCTLIFCFNFVYFLNQYFVQQNYFHAYDWQYGYSQAIPEIQKIKNNYSKIVVSDRDPLDKSYMFFLYYLKYSPAEFQEIGRFSSGGFNKNHNFDKYEFRVINWDNDQNIKRTLFVGSEKDFPIDVRANKNFNAIKIINYPNGKPAIMIIGT